MDGRDFSMKVCVIYDSVFGNTEKIARAVGEALSTAGEVSIVPVSSATVEQFQEVDLLVVGSPTRGFRPTKPLSEFLDRIPNGGLKGVKAAAFDTRISVQDVKNGLLNVLVKFFGYAAKPIATGLIKKGAEPIISPEGFYVKESEGPLKDGELERAGEWAKLLAAAQ
jgi:flavodoxin